MPVEEGLDEPMVLPQGTCRCYMKKNLCPDNVFTMLELADLYEESDLIEQCWDIMAMARLHVVIKPSALRL